MRTTNWFVQFLLMVALLAAISTTAFGQPNSSTPPIRTESAPQQGQSSEGQLPDDEDLDGVETPQENPPPIQPQPQQAAEQLPPLPRLEQPSYRQQDRGNNYSDGRAERQAQAWREHRATGPAYSQPAVQQVINQYIQRGIGPDDVFERFEKRLIRPIGIRKEGQKFVFLEPPARSDKDRRINRKLVFDIAAEKDYLRVVWLKELGCYQARFQPEKKDEIINWIMIESSLDVITALQITFRNFVIDEFEPLKVQVATNTGDIAQLKADVLALQNSTNTKPGVVVGPVSVVTTTNQTVAANTTINTTTDANGTTSNSSASSVVANTTTNTTNANGTTGNTSSTSSVNSATSNVTTPPEEETPMAIGNIVVPPRVPPPPDPAATPLVPKDAPSTTPRATKKPDAPTSAMISPTAPQEGSGFDYWPWLGGLAILGLGAALAGTRYHRKRLKVAAVRATEVIDGEIVE